MTVAKQSREHQSFLEDCHNLFPHLGQEAMDHETSRPVQHQNRRREEDRLQQRISKV